MAVTAHADGPVVGARDRRRPVRRIAAVSSLLVAVSGLVASTGSLPAAAASLPGVPGTPAAGGMARAAALKWSAPADAGSPPLAQYRVEANGGSGWTPATAEQGIESITAGYDHSCALLDDGTVKCWGYNAYGQLGLGDTSYRGDGPGEMGDSLPAVSLGTGRTAVAVTAGAAHSCALLDNGTVKCWGYNYDGELGLGDAALRGDGPGEMGDSLPAVALGAGRTAVTVAAGLWHTCALLDNGAVKCWGANAYGKLGLGDTAHRGDEPGEMGDNLSAAPLGTGRTAVAITAGIRHTCALLDDGTVRCWGGANRGQLGLGDTSERGDDPGEMGDKLPAVALGTGRTAIAIAAGYYHTCALLDDGTMKCWGQNASGDLGYGNTAIRGDGPGEMGNNLAAVALGTGRNAVTMTAGHMHTCAVLDNGTVKCWGDNSAGQLGLGDTADRGDDPGEMGNNLAAIALGTGRTAVAVTAGDQHSCALLDNATLKCWGQNVGGNLGLGDTAVRGDGPGEMGNNLAAVSLGAGRSASPPRAAVVRLTPGTYHLRVVAVSSAGESAPSGASASVTVTASPPGAPTLVKAVPGSTTKATGPLKVSFRAGARNGSAITGFTARCASNNGGATHTKTGTASPLTVTSLTTGKRYTCTVRATNARGTGPASEPSAAAIVGAPAAPTHVTAVKVAAGSLKVRFTPGANNGRAITGYTAACVSSNGGATRSKTGTASPITVAHLTAGKRYTCTVRATNARGTGLASAPSASVKA